MQTQLLLFSVASDADADGGAFAATAAPADTEFDFDAVESNKVGSWLRLDCDTDVLFDISEVPVVTYCVTEIFKIQKTLFTFNHLSI